MSHFIFDTQPNYRILTNNDIESIHENSLKLLENFGVRFESDEPLNILSDFGATVDKKTNTVKMPRQLVENCIKQAPSSFYLWDTLGENSILVDTKNVYFYPTTSAIEILNADGFTTRRPKIEDAIEFARIVETLENVKLQCVSLVLSDLPDIPGDPLRLFINLLHCRKPIIANAFSPEGTEISIKMLEAISNGNHIKKPAAVFAQCPSSPLVWSKVVVDNLVIAAREGFPLLIVSIPLAGANSPVTLAGTVLQHNIEVLSGIVLAECISPGLPIVYGGAPLLFDMKYATTTYGSMETRLMNMAINQMGKFYGFPTRTSLGMSDSKLIDVQMGWETGMSLLLAAISGVSLVHGIGSINMNLCQSYEKLLIDDDLCGMLERLAQGVNTEKEYCAVRVIEEVGSGGDYITHPHTLKFFKDEFYQTSNLTDRYTRTEWVNRGSKSAYERAREQVENILLNEAKIILNESNTNHICNIIKPYLRKYNVPESTISKISV